MHINLARFDFLSNRRDFFQKMRNRAFRFNIKINPFRLLYWSDIISLNNICDKRSPAGFVSYMYI
jgi:hypothetical protein